MTAKEKDDLRQHLEGLRRAAWDLECSCPDRPDLYHLLDRLDHLESWLEEQHVSTLHEHDL